MEGRQGLRHHPPSLLPSLAPSPLPLLREEGWKGARKEMRKRPRSLRSPHPPFPLWREDGRKVGTQEGRTDGREDGRTEGVEAAPPALTLALPRLLGPPPSQGGKAEGSKVGTEATPSLLPLAPSPLPSLHLPARPALPSGGRGRERGGSMEAGKRRGRKG